MYGFVHRYRVLLSCGFFLVFSLFLAAVNSRAPYRVDPVGVLLLEVMHPLQLGVSAHAAQVLLISDPDSGVDVLVQRTRARGIVAGTIEGGCLLKYIQRGDDVAVGDTVITSGLDGIFPKGQLIGTVARVGKKNSRIFQDVEVILSAELAKVEEVLVVAPGVVRAGE